MVFFVFFLVCMCPNNWKVTYKSKFLASIDKWESSDTGPESPCCNSLWDCAVAASLVKEFYFFIVSQTVLALNFGKQQPFDYAHGFCESGIWTRHSGNDLFSLHSV